MPPVHPALVHFPIALVTMSVVADLVFFLSGSRVAAIVAWWSLAVAAVSAIVTALAGYWDMQRASLDHQTHELVHIHMRIGIILAAAIMLLSLWRWLGFYRHERVISGGYIAASLLVLAVTFFQGWYGSEMVYAHGAGVAATGQGMVPEEEARERLEPIVSLLKKVPGLHEGHSSASAKDHERSGQLGGASPEVPR